MTFRVVSLTAGERFSVGLESNSEVLRRDEGSCWRESGTELGDEGCTTSHWRWDSGRGVGDLRNRKVSADFRKYEPD